MKNIIVKSESGLFTAYTLRNSNFVVEQVKFIDGDNIIDTGNVDAISIYYNVNNSIKINNLLSNGGELKLDNTPNGLSKGEPDFYTYNKETERFMIKCGGEERKKFECDIILKKEYIREIQFLLFQTYERYKEEHIDDKQTGKSTERVQKYRQSKKLAKEREPLLNLYPEAIEKYKEINYKNLKPDLTNEEIKNKLLKSDLFDEIINVCKNDKRKRFM